MSDDTVMIRPLTSEITTISWLFLRWDKVSIGGRATLVKLPSGSLFVVSPGPLTPSVIEAVSSAGSTVAYLVCPDIEHHMFLGVWAAKFPDAKVIAPTGLREKRAKQGNEDVPISWEVTSTSGLPQELQDVFEVEFFPGHVNKEVVLLHKPSKTLITADLVFNLPSKESFLKVQGGGVAGVWNKLGRYFGGLEGEGQARFNWYALAHDRKSFGESAKRVNEWDFDRIVMCHGDVIETGGKEIYRKIFKWFL
ncbi:beta-lactamase-like protein [Crassisporium funariophilum]|nr:beta-lactamase-like protein [Crassisporium funariophilum]